MKHKSPIYVHNEKHLTLFQKFWLTFFCLFKNMDCVCDLSNVPIVQNVSVIPTPVQDSTTDFCHKNKAIYLDSKFDYSEHYTQNCIEFNFCSSSL